MESSNRVIIPLITPFDEDFNIDLDAFSKHIERLYNAGVRRFFPSSSTGELDRLSIDEVTALAEAILNNFNDVEVYPGIFSLGTLEAVSKIDYLDSETEVTGYIIPTPPYFKYGLNELMSFYREILLSTDKKIIIYVIPSNTGVLPDPKLYLELGREFDNLEGVKITFNDVTYLASVLRTVRELGDRFKVYVGSDLLSLVNLILGGYGVIPGLGNIIPRLYLEMIDKYLDGAYEEAFRLYRLLHRATELFNIPNKFPAVIKYALEVLDLGVKRFVRPPMESVEDKYRSDVLTLLRAYGEFF